MDSFLQRLEKESQTRKPVVMAFGRMNPPTIGHEKLVDRVKQIAKDYNAPHHVIISHSVDAKKNPLDAQTKLKHAKRFFPNTNIEVSSKEQPTFLQHAARLNQSRKRNKPKKNAKLKYGRKSCKTMESVRKN